MCSATRHKDFFGVLSCVSDKSWRRVSWPSGITCSSTWSDIPVMKRRYGSPPAKLTHSSPGESFCFALYQNCLMVCSSFMFFAS